MNTDRRQYTIRQATEADLAALTDIKSPMSIHRDRLRDADGDRLLYLVIEEFGTIIGFGLFVFERPPSWPDANDNSRLPALVDLLVRPDHRNHGAGSFLIRWMEGTALARESTHLYIGVDPVDSPRAHQLYLRLGYVPLQTQPYRSHWRFTDSDGNAHEGSEWIIDMVKELGQGTESTQTTSHLTRRPRGCKPAAGNATPNLCSLGTEMDRPKQFGLLDGWDG